MTDFMASNGVVIGRDEEGHLELRGELNDFLWEEHEVALREYFAFEAKPWEAAKRDEIWIITAAGQDVPAICGEHDWLNVITGGPVTARPITAGRRVWPEGDES